MKRLSVKLLSFLCGVLLLTCPGVAVSQEARPVPKPVTNGGLPSVSPDGSLIAFVSDRTGASDLFVISKNGAHEIQLTHTPESEGVAGWTRDSKQVLFSVFANDFSTLYAIDIKSKHQRELGKFPGRVPTPSNDLKHVAYMAGTWTATRLMISAMDASNPRQLTDGSSIAWNVHWSPDNKYLSFTGRDTVRRELAIFVMNADGSNLRQVTHIDLAEGGAQWPVWSPNGKHLAIQVNCRTTKNSAYIWIVDIASGDARKLGTHEDTYVDETPSWFPDGSTIAFQTDRSGRMEIWTMKTDGTSQTQITGRAKPL